MRKSQMIEEKRVKIHKSGQTQRRFCLVSPASRSAVPPDKRDAYDFPPRLAGTPPGSRGSA